MTSRWSPVEIEELPNHPIRRVRSAGASHVRELQTRSQFRATCPLCGWWLASDWLPAVRRRAIDHASTHAHASTPAPVNAP
ncbi:MAG TPA: hypothetical protein VHN98_13030 [Acidimicrobiales bacterium]|nr:hypothetical protein [Acidimicrobiales bacterium]